MPFIKDAKTGLPGYVMPDFVEEEPQPTIYGEPGITAAEVREVKEVWDAIEKEKKADDPDMDYATRQPRDPVPDPDFDAIEKRVNGPHEMSQAEEEQCARARALSTACEFSGFQTPEAAVYRASVYAKYIKDGTVPPADGLPPPETPPSLPPTE